MGEGRPGRASFRGPLRPGHLSTSHRARPYAPHNAAQTVSENRRADSPVSPHREAVVAGAWPAALTRIWRSTATRLDSMYVLDGAHTGVFHPYRDERTCRIARLMTPADNTGVGTSPDAMRV